MKGASLVINNKKSDAYPAQLDVPHAEPVASDMSYDPDAQERADLIEKCLAHGLTDEEIEGVLREHMFQKMMEKEMIAEGQAAKAAAPQMPEYDAPPMRPANSSVAAKRQAKAMAKKSASFGPSDDEIAEIIEVGRTPSPTEMHVLESTPATMKMKNDKAKQVAVSGFNVAAIPNKPHVVPSWRASGQLPQPKHGTAMAVVFSDI